MTKLIKKGLYILGIAGLLGGLSSGVYNTSEADKAVERTCSVEFMSPEFYKACDDQTKHAEYMLYSIAGVIGASGLLILIHKDSNKKV